MDMDALEAAQALAGAQGRALSSEAVVSLPRNKGRCGGQHPRGQGGLMQTRSEEQRRISCVVETLLI